MKRSILTAAIVASIFTSCSKDVDVSPISLIPNGEIVSFEKRDQALTGEGFDNSGALITEEKWWQGLENVNIITGCGDQDDEISTDLTTYYVSFRSNGTIYQKTGRSGTPFHSQNWNWSDDTKTAMYLSQLGYTFEVNFLNDDNIVYSLDQTVAGTCRQIVYEQYNNPYFE